MKLRKTTWFTLIELIFAIGVLSIMLVASMSIFHFVSRHTHDSEDSAFIHENIRNVFNHLSQDQKEFWFWGVSVDKISPCIIKVEGKKFISWDKLCFDNGPSYYVAQKFWDNYIRVDDIADCRSKINDCTIVRNGKRILSNQVFVSDLEFRIFHGEVSKIFLNLELYANSKKLKEPHSLRIQTTLSERIF